MSDSELPPDPPGRPPIGPFGQQSHPPYDQQSSRAAAPPAVERRIGAGAAVRADLRIAAVLAVSLAVLGAVLGLVWAAWSPAGPRALVLSPGVIEPDETEAFAAGDGRFLVISAVVGVFAALIAWRMSRHRGAPVLLALAVGGVVGALLMELVGHLTGGGTFLGLPNTLIAALPLSLHMQGLLFVEPGLAVLVYGMIVAFAVRDDLGRPDPVRDQLVLVGAVTHADGV